MEKVAIFYGSSMGNTQTVAEKLAEKLNADIFDVADGPEDKLGEYKNLIFGSSTWGAGDLQDDWEDFISSVEAADLSGKVVAIYGFGDGCSYSDTFVDAMGTIYEAVKDKASKVVGQTDTSSYEFDASTAVVDGKFIGLALDEDNQGDLTDDRVDTWVEQIRAEFI